MSKEKGVKTGAFKVMPENQSQTFGIQSDRDAFRCVVPAPMQDYFKTTYLSELDAWKAIIGFRVNYPSAMQWNLVATERCLTLLKEDFHKQPLDQKALVTDWLIFRAGTEARDIENWLSTI